jgi:hypothetical protein
MRNKLKQEACELVLESLMSHIPYMDMENKIGGKQQGPFIHHLKAIRDYLRLIEIIHIL